jgi:hypothetical protein
VIPLPHWVDPEAWAEYVDQRKRDKKALTPRSAKQRLARLYELKAAGHDPNACIDEAINGHWLDFYAPKDKPIERKASNGTGALEELAANRAEWERNKPDPAKVRSIVESIKGRIYGRQA